MQDRSQIPDRVVRAFAENAKHFPSPLQLVQFVDKYSRWQDHLGRRETWPETVERSVEFLDELSDYKLPESTIDEIRQAMLAMQVMPSMRLVAMAGEAARRNNISIYNCAAEGIDHPYAFVEGLLISMAGAGFGYSVERRFVDQLPVVGDSGWIQTFDSPQDENGDYILDVEILDWAATAVRYGMKYVHTVKDSSSGWAEALALGLVFWWDGYDHIEFDFSQVRKKGEKLKTKGGTASGPEPLRELLHFARELILGARGRKLRPIEAHDLMCKIADCVVSGGVRRSAMIALFDFDDEEMLNAKPFGFWDDPKLAHRSNANNSAVMPYRDSPDGPVYTPSAQANAIEATFRRMVSNHSGEPGVFSRANAIYTMPERRRELSWSRLFDLLTNPCGEIYLLNGQFCNLSIVVARPGMSFDDYARAVRVASIIGTIQATATKFPGLRPKWRENCEAERLLGVDITGQADVDTLTPDVLEALREVAVETNVEFAELLGIARAAAVTCVKPGGNSAALLGCSSGISEEWASFYIRRLLLDRHGVMAKVLRASGWELEEPAVVNDGNRDHVYALFPIKARNPTRTKRDVSAIDQCNTWLKNKRHWTEHNPSCTITYRPHEVDDVATWLRDHESEIGGMAFLPADDGVYPNAPYETISEERYNEMAAALPPIDMAKIWLFEDHDTTTVAREVACSAGSCDIL
jgi:ribonucleoside-diphosphate reductase alpha chain